MSDPLRFRQSRLRSYTNECPRRTILVKDDETTGFVGSASDLGSALHAVVAEILRTLRRLEEPQASTQECIEIMREVMNAGPWILAAEDEAMLVQMVLSFARHVWKPERFLGIEDRLSMDITCPDGRVRTLTGAPDLTTADPPRAVVIVDFKSGLAKPRTPREEPPEGEAIKGIEYLSPGAFFQLWCYGALAMYRWPRIQHAILQEQNERWGGPAREAVLTRADLEHVLPYLGRIMMQLDRGLTEGDGSPFAKPRPGAHCTTRCPVARSCPIPQEQRGLGVLLTPEDAEAEAARWVVISALKDQMRKSLKAWHEENERPIQVGDALLQWHDKPSGGREFCVRAA